MKQKIINLLRKNQENLELLKRIVEFVEKNSDNRFEWYHVRVHPTKLKSLFLNGILKILYKSNKTTEYSLVDLEKTKEAIKTFENARINCETEKELEIPNNLFDDIVNYDDLKEQIIHTLKNDIKVHYLFYGPPATAKSLFLEKLRSLPRTCFCVGSMTTKAGLAQVLIENNPKILLFDEIDKAEKRDLAVLLNILQDQEIVITKHNKQYKIKTDIIVFATANRIDKLPEELKSRFLMYKFNPYDEKEFIKVSVNQITNGIGKSENLAEYIAEKVWREFPRRDVRIVINLAKMSSSVNEAEKNIQVLLRYQ